MLVAEYLNIQKKYEALYGHRTVVLYAVGVFYEIWEYDPSYCTDDKHKIESATKIWDERIGHAIEISVILNCTLTFEDVTKPYTFKSPHKVGFPLIAYDKNLATLLANDYTVVRIDQDKNSKPVTRSVTEICSPTMQLDNISLSRPTSNIACIYIEYQQGLNHRYENFLITTGASVVDIITGQNHVCEFYSKTEDQVHAVQELYRFLISHSPRELIIHVNDMPPGLDTHTEENPNLYIKYLERVLELRRFDRLTTHVNTVISDYKKLPYQIEFLNKVFNKAPVTANKGLSLNVIQKRNDRIIEDIGLERMNYGRIAYMLLLQHCYCHNTTIISKLSKPNLKWLDEKRHLILTHNAIIQLDLIPAKEVKYRKKSEIDSLMSVLDHNQTHLGRRMLHTLLQNPMLDPVEIQTYYDMVDEMSTMIDMHPLWMILDKQLKELPDIGRLQRKLELKIINPKELTVLYKAYVKIVGIYVAIMNINAPILHSQLFTQEDVTSFNGFISRFGAIINFEALECCHIDTSAETDNKWLEFTECPIKSGIYADLDSKVTALVDAETNLQNIVDHLNSFLGNSKGKKLEFKASKRKVGAKKQDPGGVLLLTTAAKATMLGMAPIDKVLCGNVQVLPYNTSDRMIVSDKISALCSEIDSIRTQMRHYLYLVYEAILEEITTKYNFFVPVANLIAKIDLVHCYALVTHKYNYHRPELVVDDNDVSYLEAREIRHPIIERLIDGAYVTNDVFLGRGDDARSNGMLLYGINESGKSSLLKAVALTIIMAQIGCFAPAYLKYKPYSKIISRLSGGDNMFKGQSTFIVEGTEIRTVIRQSDGHTLAILDEVARGTESKSATAITVATIKSSIRQRCTFILSTHMHHIIELPHIANLEPNLLNVCHLTVNYDEPSDSLIYDRKLQSGAGSSVYGLTVIKSLGFPVEFINDANEVLLYLDGNTGNIIEPRTSRYNSQVYVDSCSVCGKSRLQTELQSHHIEEQYKADERNLIGNMHKNVKNNLVVLCKDCHSELHKNKMEFETLSTSNGQIVRLKPEIDV